MQKTTVTIMLVAMLVALTGCEDNPQTQSGDSGAPTHRPSESAGPKPSVAPAAGVSSAENRSPSPEPSAKPSATPKPVRPSITPSAVTDNVYGAEPSPEDMKALSWYYMKKKKGEVPDFPHDIKNYRPDHKVVWVGTGKKVYLTFDTGGPLGDIDKMLKTLKDHDVKATYFIAGYNMEKNPDFIRRLEADGHLVVNHSMSHKDFTTMTDDQVRKEIRDYEKLYKEITGKDIQPYFRFPYGKYSIHLLDVLSEMDYTSVFWSTAMRDWEPRKNGAEDAYNDIMNNLHPGNIVLMHQASQENIDALERIIQDIRKEGYEFGLVNELQANHR